MLQPIADQSKIRGEVLDTIFMNGRRWIRSDHVKMLGNYPLDQTQQLRVQPELQDRATSRFLCELRVDHLCLPKTSSAGFAVEKRILRGIITYGSNDAGTGHRHCTKKGSHKRGRWLPARGAEGLLNRTRNGVGNVVLRIGWVVDAIAATASYPALQRAKLSDRQRDRTHVVIQPDAAIPERGISAEN